MTNQQSQVPEETILALRDHLTNLVSLAEAALASPQRFEPDDHLAYMTLSFTARQLQHAHSVLLLQERPDVVLIVRSMWEGLSQLLWAAQSPDDRPLRWRASAFVADWRRMRKDDLAGNTVPPEVRAGIESGLQRYGSLLLTEKARKAQGKGRPLPEDPYLRHWYEGTERDIFQAVGGQQAYDELYGPYSEWHHWRVAAIGLFLEFDEQERTFQLQTTSRAYSASALAGAFQCLLQTLSMLKKAVPEVSLGDLDEAYEKFLAGARPPETVSDEL